METQTKKTVLISIILQVLSIGFCIYGTILSVLKVDSFYIYYTQQSNFFAGFICILSIIFEIRFLMKGNQIPYFVKVLKFMASCCLSITFLVVVFVLTPPYGPKGYIFFMLQESNLAFHFVSPVLLFVSFAFFTPLPELKKSSIAITTIPTFIYAFTMIPLNIMQKVSGPYPFLKVRENSVAFSVIFFVGFIIFINLLAFGIYVLNKKTSTKVC